MNKDNMSKMHIKTFINLINNFSSDSPSGRIEQLLLTENKNLNGNSIIFKNRIIKKRAGIKENW